MARFPTLLAAILLPVLAGAPDASAQSAGGYGPEWPTPGVHIQVITKYGGNAHHGTVVAAYEHRDWQSHNIDARQIALGAAGSEAVPPREANRLRHYHDVNADAGGFITRDRVWWYTSVRHQGRSARQVIFAAEPIESTIISATAKSTVRLTDRQRVVVYGSVRIAARSRGLPLKANEDVADRTASPLTLARMLVTS